jgi:hypothetical protein
MWEMRLARRCSGRVLCGRGNLAEKLPAIKAGPRLDPQWFNFVARATQAFRGLLIGGMREEILCGCVWMWEMRLARRCSGRVLCGRGNLAEKLPTIKAGPRLDPQWFNFVARATQAFRGLLLGGNA